MKLTPLYNPTNGTMPVAALMSGSGSNVRKLIEHERAGNCPYHIAVIFSDRADSHAEQIAQEYNLPIVVHDIRAFYKARHKPLSDMATRAEFDQTTIDALKSYHIKVAAYAGYMSIASDLLVNAFIGVNVHPADLSIMDETGKRIYIGDQAVRDAIMAGESEIRATTHLVESVLDGGRILMISAPVIIPVGTSTNRSEYYQEQLKKIGDWIIFPKTLEYIATGRFAQDEQGRLYCDGQVIPQGLKL